GSKTESGLGTKSWRRVAVIRLRWSPPMRRGGNDDKHSLTRAIREVGEGERARTRTKSPKSCHDANRACGLGFCWGTSRKRWRCGSSKGRGRESAGRRAPLLFQTYP